MGRLIDADKLLETLQNLEPHCENKNYEYGMLNMMRYYIPKIINDEPTAYDPNKIVSKMEQKKFIEQEIILSDIHQGFNAGLSAAIQIVKSGGN